ncbi:hypothetical protein Ancab_016502 [Ancistrocladus abbreviatus]
MASLGRSVYNNIGKERLSEEHLITSHGGNPSINELQLGLKDGEIAKNILSAILGFAKSLVGKKNDSHVGRDNANRKNRGDSQNSGGLEEETVTLKDGDGRELRPTPEEEIND